MIVFRLTKSVHANDLTGNGAERAGGRWNSKGTPMIYTSYSRALCMAEIAVHVPLGVVPIGYSMLTIEIPDHCEMEVIDYSKLNANWRSFPPTRFTQEVGDSFIRKGHSLSLKVPSAVVQGDFNLLLNPRHPDIQHVKIIETESFIFDDRLFLK